MKSIFATFAVSALLLCSCELFTVGTSRKFTEIERSQRTSGGVVHLFKAELDSNNTTAATELMLHPSGRSMLALEKYELADDLHRWQRQFQAKPITSTTIDTIDNAHHTVKLTVDYIRNYSFSTIQVGNLWYVISLQTIQRQP